jgi:hypothetical protein
MPKLSTTMPTMAKDNRDDTFECPRVERRSIRPFDRAELNRRIASGFNSK